MWLAVAGGGQKGRLRLRLRRAKTYEEWKAIALQLDDCKLSSTQEQL